MHQCGSQRTSVTQPEITEDTSAFKGTVDEPQDNMDLPGLYSSAFSVFCFVEFTLVEM